MKRLCCAILIQAVKDYKKAVNSKKMSTQDKIEIIEFFKSSWCEQLLSVNEIAKTPAEVLNALENKIGVIKL